LTFSTSCSLTALISSILGEKDTDSAISPMRSVSYSSDDRSDRRLFLRRS
jgi:hypothetical protein